MGEETNYTKLLFFGVIVLIGVIAVGIVLTVLPEGNQSSSGLTTLSATETKESTIKETPECPYECCLTGEFKEKPCQEDYSCISSQCKPNDSDGDGLFDFEEKQLGTNISLADSDQDGLTDFIEVKQTLSNPLNPNSDGDRYKDGEDKEPTKINTAQISIEKTNSKRDPDLLTLGAVSLAILAAPPTVMGSLAVLVGVLGSNARLSTLSMDFEVTNTGDDYSSFVEFDVVTYLCKDLDDISDSVVRTDRVSLDRLEPNQTKTHLLEFDVTVGDITENITERYIDGYSRYCLMPENISYEKFE